MIQIGGIVAGGLFGSTVGGIGSGVASYFNINAGNRQLAYEENIRVPNVIPPVETIITLMQRGLINEKDGMAGLAMHGIGIGQNRGNEQVDLGARLWHHVPLLSAPIYDLPTLYNLRNRELIDEESFKQAKRLIGESYYSLSGLADISKNYIPPEGVIQLHLRGDLDKEQAKDALKNGFGYTNDEIDHLLSLGLLIPGPQDIIRFAVREAFNDEQVKELGLDDEYEENPEYQVWAKKVGLGKMNSKPDGSGQDVDWPKMYWRAHWELPSPTQMYDMLHRLRSKERIERLGDDFANTEPITLEQVTKVLKAKDYPKVWRERLAAISSAVLGRIDIRKAFRIGKMPEDEVKEQYLDRGYGQEDAKILVEIAKKDKDDFDKAEKKRQLGAELNAIVNQTKRAFEAGLIDEPTAFEGLNRVYEDTEKTTYAISAINLKVRTEFANAYVKSIRTAFFTGMYDASEAENDMIQAGIVEQQAGRLVSLWQRQFTLPRKMASTEKLMQWRLAGFISADELEDRLRKMGWANADILLWAAESESDEDAKRAKEEALRARTEAQRIKAAERMQKASARQWKDKAAEFRRMFPVAAIGKWYKYNLISEDKAREFLAEGGGRVESIDLYVAQWKKELNDGQQGDDDSDNEG